MMRQLLLLVVTAMLALTVAQEAAAQTPTAPPSRAPIVEAQAPPTPRALSLREAVGIAVRQHPNVRGADARVRGLEAQIDVTRAAYLPTVSGTLTGAVGHTNRPVLPDVRVQSTYGVAEASLTGQALVYDFGRTANAVRAAEQAHAAGTADANVLRYQVALDAANRYLLVLSDRELVEVARVTLRQRELQANVTRELVARGLRPALDQNRAQLEIDIAGFEIEAAEARVAQDLAALAASLGLDPSTPLALQALDPTNLGVDPDLQRAAAAAQIHRPEIQAARAHLEHDRARIDATRALARPVLSVLANGVINRQDVISGYGLAGFSETVQAGALLSVPVLDFTVSPRVRVTESERDSAEQALHAQLLTVRAEATQAAIAARAAESMHVRAEHILRSATLNLNLAQERYAQGVSPLIEELIEAQSREQTARVNLVGARLSLQLARIQLLAATHGARFPEHLGE
ncbi:MAG TPA: TolC family protein [Polyangiaceae bacterium]|nr:TolC family protein [Polyangiaceae bacterium]